MNSALDMNTDYYILNILYSVHNVHIYLKFILFTLILFTITMRATDKHLLCNKCITTTPRIISAYKILSTKIMK